MSGRSLGEPIAPPPAPADPARGWRLDGWLDRLVTVAAFLATLALIVWGPLGQ